MDIQVFEIVRIAFSGIVALQIGGGVYKKLRTSPFKMKRRTEL